MTISKIKTELMPVTVLYVPWDLKSDPNEPLTLNLAKDSTTLFIAAFTDQEKWESFKKQTNLTREGRDVNDLVLHECTGDRLLPMISDFPKIVEEENGMKLTIRLAVDPCVKDGQPHWIELDPQQFAVANKNEKTYKN